MGVEKRVPQLIRIYHHIQVLSASFIIPEYFPTNVQMLEDEKCTCSLYVSFEIARWDPQLNVHDVTLPLSMGG